MSAPASLIDWGWDAVQASAFAAVGDDGQEPGRILVEDRGSYLVATGSGDARATVSGRFRFDAELEGQAGFPVVGDWVRLQATSDPGHRLIQGLVPRRTSVIRRAPVDRSSVDQVLAANVDLLLIVTSLNADLNLRRLERYLALAWSSGAQPVVVLNKADLAADVDGAVARVALIASGAPVHAVSATTGIGMAGLAELFGDGRTAALIGSSGVGKSTLLNALAGEEIEGTGAIREGDDEGRHTTTRRHLVRVPGRGLILDTPGMRELSLADDDGGLDAAFADIDELGSGCRFADCRHDREPGCAVRAAIEAGSLDPARLANRDKLEREQARREGPGNARERAERKRQFRMFNTAVNRHMKMKYGDDGR